MSADRRARLDWGLPGADLSQPVRAAFGELRKLRRALGARAGLAHRVERTVSDYLEAAGVAHRELAEGGLVGLIAGRRQGPVLLLRADVDALPPDRLERGAPDGLADGESPSSTGSEAARHGPGREAQVAMLLVAARLLGQQPPSRGAVKLVFQPTEEHGAGAARMIAAGVLGDPEVDRALALCACSSLSTGQVALVPGPARARVDAFELTVRGKGAHAAFPERGVDPIVLAAQIVSAAQSLVSRRVPPHQPAVLSFSSVHGRGSLDAIAERVVLQGTIRTFDRRARDRLVDELGHLAASLAAVSGGDVQYKAVGALPALVNDVDTIDAVRSVAASVVGQDRVVPGEPMMAGEDFGLFLRRVPGALIALGGGRPDTGADSPHRHPRVAFDERVLPVGVELTLRLVRHFLSDSRTAGGR